MSLRDCGDWEDNHDDEENEEDDCDDVLGDHSRE